MKYICQFKYGDALPTSEDGIRDIKVFGSNGPYNLTQDSNTLSPVIVVGRKGSYGKVNWSDEAVFASDTTYFVDSSSTQNHLRWLYWMLQTLNLDTGSGEAAVPGLSREHVYEREVWLPPLEQQQQIADYLDCETTQMDALILEKETMLGLLEQKRAALVSRAVTRGLNPRVELKDSGLEWLGEIPAHWETMQLKRVWQSAEYGISEDIRGNGPVKVLRMSCIVDGEVDLKNAGEVEEVEESLLLVEGDILFNRTNSLDQVAKVGLLREAPEQPTSFASYLVRIRVNPNISRDFLVFLLNSATFIKFAVVAQNRMLAWSRL